MRIISGQYRGRKLAAPKGDATRPTADRTREALFSMLTSRLGSFDDLAVLDLFSGSGALGLEALSRGAASCLFVEQDRAALDALKANIAALGAKNAEVRSGSVLALGQARTAYDLILLDPPYGSGAGAVALDKLNRQGWIAPSAWIALETANTEAANAPGFIIESERTIGKGRLTLLRPPPSRRSAADEC